MKFGAGGRPLIALVVETIDFGARLRILAPFFSSCVSLGKWLNPFVS